MTKLLDSTQPLLEAYRPLAVELADESGYTLTYTVAGLLSEYGEVVGKYAKHFWHRKWTPDEFRDELALEFGDIFWMNAVLIDVLHDPTAEISKYYPMRYIHELYQDNVTEESEVLENLRNGREDLPSPRTALSELGAELNAYAEKVDSALASSARPYTYYAPHFAESTKLFHLYWGARDLWLVLLETAGVVTGLDPSTILDMNLHKLHSRSKRGVLAGFGDHR